MGIYLNPGHEAFKRAVSSEIYVDKTGLLSYTNKRLGTEQMYICVSRPRRFGKSMAANMLTAYYGRGSDSSFLFGDKKIAKDPSFQRHMNQYHVIFLNMQEFFSRTHDVEAMKSLIEKCVLRDLLREYADLDYFDRTDLIGVLQDIYAECRIPFVFVIDEWDCIFRERKDDSRSQKIYLDFLRNLLKDKVYVALAYMTGILPIKKYGTHSALNMFDEFSMTNPKQLAEFVGFTEEEVKCLCRQYEMDFEETRRWYDGYHFENVPHVYSPKSVVSAMLSRSFDSYWNQTETFEALRDYIVMNFEGLKETIVSLLAGRKKSIDIGSFSNDMTSFSSSDNVLTLLVHLGYLGYDFPTREVFIPNFEISSEFVRAVESAGWENVIQALKQSDDLLKAIWKRDEKKVASGIDKAHLSTSILTYNNENSLACVLSLALFRAKEYYTEVRELPAGKGYADLVYVPRKKYLNYPALIVELKWDKDAEGAIAQIKRKEYVQETAF
ncbi:MAG: AAA family ATPase [Lachnospiraceae bacterium]|nr:AAA family ATPase [Lachnospiraceae bacterium]